MDHRKEKQSLVIHLHRTRGLVNVIRLTAPQPEQPIEAGESRQLFFLALRLRLLVLQEPPNLKTSWANSSHRSQLSFSLFLFNLSNDPIAPASAPYGRMPFVRRSAYRVSSLRSEEMKTKRSLGLSRFTFVVRSFEGHARSTSLG